MTRHPRVPPLQSSVIQSGGKSTPSLLCKITRRNMTHNVAYSSFFSFKEVAAFYLKICASDIKTMTIVIKICQIFLYVYIFGPCFINELFSLVVCQAIVVLREIPAIVRVLFGYQCKLKREIEKENQRSFFSFSSVMSKANELVTNNEEKC